MFWSWSRQSPEERHRAELEARLPALESCFSDPLERRALAYAITGVRNHRQWYVDQLHLQVSYAIKGSSLEVCESLNVAALVEKLRLLDALDREAVVGAMEFAWSRVGQVDAPGIPFPHQLFDRLVLPHLEEVA